MIIAKRPVSIYDFKAFGAAIKAARNEYGESRNLANIDNKGQQPSLQVFYDLVTRYADIWVCSDYMYHCYGNT